MTEYWTGEELDATGANYRIAYGERGPGKTYFFKRQALDRFVERGEQFAYVRRSAAEVKAAKMCELFADQADYINKCMSERYPAYSSFAVMARSGAFWLYGYDEHDMRQPIGAIGYYFALVNSRYNKSVAYPHVTTLCYDEFIPDESKGEYELPGEFSTLLNLISTIKRKRTDFVVYMFGNSVSRNSGILSAMGINVRDIPQGAIKCYSYHDGDVVNTVAVEYTRHYQQDSASEAFFVFGSRREMMIRDGSYEVDEYQRPTVDVVDPDARAMLGIVFDCSTCRLYGYAMSDGSLWIRPQRWQRAVDYITLTTGDSRPKYNRFGWAYPGRRLEALRHRIVEAVNTGRVVYDDDYTGDDFRHFLLEADAAV